MTDNWRISYSEMLHDAAAAWGLEVMEGRPLIGLPPASKEGIVGNPYQPTMPPIETIHKFTIPPYNHNEIKLFKFNGRWGYCLSLSTSKQGMSYGPWIKFCKPYPTEYEALEAAVDRAIEWATGKDERLVKWLKGLTAPQQISMF